MSSKEEIAWGESPAAGRFAMEMFGLAAMQPVSKSNSQSVIRNLNELTEEDKYSVIYEIARIETLLSRHCDITTAPK